MIQVFEIKKGPNEQPKQCVSFLSNSLQTLTLSFKLPPKDHKEKLFEEYLI